mmetsp:Transcript_18116/g.30943  ORF Transcript_18116/g.30943 Transcript_18116/m.30943 type:complete len:101 (+) Transcript_18116:651-953(+)
MRGVDQQNLDQLIPDLGLGEAPNNQGRRQANRNADGMIVPAAMRNYQERDVLGGMMRLRSYERIDLFWGYFKDVERDFIIYNAFIFLMGVFIVGYILLSS